ncbi:MAG: PIN domain-containing protein [Alphaproteobacteria bacterium]|uniref:type II toxin-antitoxin system VapC family toxin n=1 Tax=Bradyrhizobium sp. TaxID=376 RepID=UPI001EC445AA|nr:PIN domain-containing protein [Bradyrhizobium sp.]MBV9570850.1 PIN domain-containing protein [Alphaproteobacteria bacterium]MBV9979100.1 PIN domain-containing protein [Bradyrhizobium sp.]
MGSLNIGTVADGALLLLDSPPIIYVLERHRELAARFLPLFERQAEGRLSFAVTTVTVAEVLTGPLQAGNEALARRYRTVLESWQVVPLDTVIAESAARLRATLRLKLPDAVQLASALAIGADALVTHDRDFSGVRALPVIS